MGREKNQQGFGTQIEREKINKVFGFCGYLFKIWHGPLELDGLLTYSG